MNKKKRGRPKNPPKEIGKALPCYECNAPGEYYTDTFGIVDGQWRCRTCHEQACRRVIRNDYYFRYGDR